MMENPGAPGGSGESVRKGLSIAFLLSQSGSLN